MHVAARRSIPTLACSSRFVARPSTPAAVGRRSRTRFVSNWAHDINELVRLTRKFADAIQDEPSTAAIAKASARDRRSARAREAAG